MNGRVGRLLAIARKEFRDIAREKTLVVAFLVQLFIAGFSTLLLTGLIALNDVGAVGTVPDIPVAYDGPGDAVQFLEQEGFRIEPMDADAAWDAFDDGDVGAIVFEVTEEVQNITVILPAGELHTSLFIAGFQDAFADYEEALRHERDTRLQTDLVVFPAPAASGASYTFVHATLVPLLVLTPVVLAGAIVGDSVGQERRRGTLAVLRSTPASLRTVMAGKLLVAIALVPLQVALWGLLLAVNGFPIHMGALLVLATILAALLAGIGLLVTTLVEDEAVSQAAYAVVVLIVGAAAITMPRDPLNLITLFAAGVPDTVAWVSLVVMAAVVFPLLVGIARFVEYRLRTA